MADSGLFEALARAKAQPDRWARAVNAGGQAGEDIIGGYMQGKELGQTLDKYRLLSTPLGSMYPDPSQIPFGLGPQHTVKDLLTIAPAMENYAPADFMRGVAKQYGASVDSPAPASGPPVPIAGAENPAPTPGTTNLQDIQGTGAGNGANLPPGTPPALNIPRGGMGMGPFQKVVIPALNAAREGRQFQQGQTAEESRFERGQQNEKNRTMAGETAKIAPSLTSAGTIQDDINALLPLYKGYSPTPFLGKTLANVTARSGSSTFGTPTMQVGKQIEQITPILAAKVNYLVNKRFNSGEAAMLQKLVVPNASDDEGNARQKIGNLQRLVAVMQGGDINALQMVASSIMGRPVNPVLPSSNPSIQALPSQSSQGRYKIGQVIKGRTGNYIYKGGNESDQNSFQKVQ